VKEYQEQEENN